MPTVPLLSALTELVSGAVTEDFKKLLKPSALVAAAIFLTLNLVLILPVLRELDVGVVTALDRLSTAWQIAVGTLLLFALAYVVHSLGDAFVGLISGAAFADSPIVGSGLRRLQEAAYDRLASVANDLASGKEQQSALATQRLALEFPDRGALAPTRLGNVLAATSAYVTNRYGAHLNTLWPYMDAVLQEQKGSELRDQLDGNRDALTFLATLTSLLGIIALELALVRLATPRPWQALWALAILMVAYLAYSAAVLKAKAWRADVCTAFELYLDKVAEKLHLLALQPKEWEKAKQRWERVSRWLAYGGSKLRWQRDWDLLEVVRPEDASWYEKPAQPTLQLDHPDTVTVKKVLQGARLCTVSEVAGKTWALHSIYNYCYAIANPASGEHALPADGVYLAVTDPAVLETLTSTTGTLTDPRHYGSTPPTAPTGQITGSPEPGAEAKTLLWYIGRIDPASCRLLHYEVVADVPARVTVVTGKLDVVDISLKDQQRMHIDFHNLGAADQPGEVRIDLPHGQGVKRAPVHKLGGTLPELYQLCPEVKALPGQPTVWTVKLKIPGTDMFRLTMDWR